MIYEAYIEEPALEQIETHFTREAGKGLEAMGLLCGRAAKWEGKPYVVIDEYLTGTNSATSVTVRFEQTAFADMAEKINSARKSGKLIVGWAHAHPNYGCFLSQTDLRTQSQYFREEFNVALVIDPIRKEKKFFKLDGNRGYRQASHAVYRRK